MQFIIWTILACKQNEIACLYVRSLYSLQASHVFSACLLSSVSRFSCCCCCFFLFNILFGCQHYHFYSLNICTPEISYGKPFVCSTSTFRIFGFFGRLFYDITRAPWLKYTPHYIYFEFGVFRAHFHIRCIYSSSNEQS